MGSLVELLGVLLASFGINMIPFASPSNLLIASNTALIVNSDPLSIGVVVALGATCAKLIHYVVSFFIGKSLGEGGRKRLDTAAAKVRRWAFLAVFIASATPIPDDPVIIPLGLMKYNPAKFTLAYFAGKLSIAVLGAYLGVFGDQFIGGYTSQGILVVISIALTVTITLVLLRVDLSRKAEKMLKKLGWAKNSESDGESV